MSAGYLELFLEQGEDFSVDITLDSINNSPYDISNYSVKSQIRKSYWSANTTAQFNTTITSNNVLTISLTSPVTQNVASGRYVYDVFLTSRVSNTRSKILEGILYVDPSSTKI
jgi:hypothetical protein